MQSPLRQNTVVGFLPFKGFAAMQYSFLFSFWLFSFYFLAKIKGKDKRKRMIAQSHCPLQIIYYTVKQNLVHTTTKSSNHKILCQKSQLTIMDLCKCLQAQKYTKVFKKASNKLHLKLNCT